MTVKHAPPQETQSFSSLTPKQLRAVEFLSLLDEKSCQPIMNHDVREASKRDESCSPKKLAYLFGSFANALSAAGIGVYTKRQRIMINQLYVVYHELGRVPTSRDTTRASKERKCSCVRTIQFQFGSFNLYIAAAGLPISRDRSKKARELSSAEKARREKVSGDEAIADLQFLTWFFERRFTGAEVGRLNRLGICRSVRTYKRALGVSTFKEALKFARCWEEDDIEQRELRNESFICIREIQEIFGISVYTTQTRIRKGLWSVKSVRHSAQGGRTGTERFLDMRQVLTFWEEKQQKYYPLALVARNLKERRKFWEGDL